MLKSLPKGAFIVMKTGSHPMISPLKLYFKWGIQFHEPYLLPDKGARKVSYMEREQLFDAVSEKYPSKKEPIGVPLEQELGKLMEEFPDIKRVRDLRTKGVTDE